MIRRSLCVTATLVLAFVGRLFGATVYVAPAPVGADSNAGTQAAPFATIAKALTSAGSSGTIYLRKGGTWRERFTLSGNRRLLAEPGEGAMPVVTGSVLVSGPFTTSGTLVTVPVTQQVLDVWVNGKFLHMARYPNTGWLRVEAGTNATRMVSSELPARPAGHWTGAQVRWRRWSWWWETRTIAADSGATTLTLPTTSIESWATGVGGNSPDGKESCFCIDNSPYELDAPGEWYWSGGTLSFIPPAGTDTASMTVEVTTSTSGITCSAGTIGGIAFLRYNATALTVTGPSTIDGCRFQEIGDTAVNCSWGSAPAFVRNNVFLDVRNVGISVNQNPSGATGSIFERNYLHRIGTDRGYGGSGPWHASGFILSNGNKLLMRLNRLVDTGYCGVIVGRAGQTIDRNIFVRTMSTLNDGGAVYTNCSHTTITQNIVLDTIGELETSMPWYPLGQGIWPEFLSDFHGQTITDNTVFGCNGNGIFMDNEYECNISRNVVVDNRTAGLTLNYVVDNSTTVNDYGVAENADDDLRPQEHVIVDNIFATSAPNRRLVRPEHLSKWYATDFPLLKQSLIQATGSVDYGTMERTTFIASQTGTSLFDGRSPNQSWTTLENWAANNASWAQPTDRLVTGCAYLLINDTESTATMPVPTGSWTRHDGSAVGATVDVPSFRSAVLVTTGTLPSTPYTVASGIDWRADDPIRTEPLPKRPPKVTLH